VAEVIEVITARGSAIAGPSFVAVMAMLHLGAPAEAQRAQSSINRALNPAVLQPAFDRAAELPKLRSLLIAVDGQIVGERYYRGAARARTANVKSVSKSIISALVGVAIAEGKLDGVDQPIGKFFPRELGDTAAPEKAEITIADLLSMRAGLESTSFDGYGRWVTSANWVRSALARPINAPRGGPMI
jgi:CubicO group peptidase (beta-lactamase class C family)